ncbi:MAG: sigma-70 family RNA polymerase sigma factor [Clostridia bacterium]|nr:sigma-70 family RNA polymerase sigma factor [Clostridia bacterium]
MNENKNRTEVNDLIVQVREDDQGAFVRMLEMYRPLLDSALARFCKDEPSAWFKEDLYQEAVLVFYNAILNYDIENEGVEFGLYAKICVKNALISQIRALEKRRAESSVPMIDDDLSGAEEPSARIIEQESLRRIDSVIRRNLSDYEYRVWCLYASGKTAKEIGALVGNGERSVANAIYRIRKKLRKLLG